MPYNHEMISSNYRLESFRTQHELARNFYDDQEFCPLYIIEEVSEHRERIKKRRLGSPELSPRVSISTSPTKKAIPIIDPSNMAPVTLPMHYTQKLFKAVHIIDPKTLQRVG